MVGTLAALDPGVGNVYRDGVCVHRIPVELEHVCHRSDGHRVCVCVKMKAFALVVWTVVFDAYGGRGFVIPRFTACTSAIAPRIAAAGARTAGATVFVSVFPVHRHPVFRQSIVVFLLVIVVAFGEPGAEPRRLRAFRRATKVARMRQRIGDRGRGGTREVPRQFGGKVRFRLDGYRVRLIPCAYQTLDVPAGVKMHQQLLRVEVVDARLLRLGVRERDPPAFKRVPGRKPPDGVASRVDLRLQGLRD